MASLSAKIIGGIETLASVKALETGLTEATVKQVRLAGIILQKHLRLHSTGKTVGQGRGIHTKRGNLGRSWQVEDVKESGGKASAVVASNHPGAKILETGGTIRPTKAKFLTIPVHPMADRRTIRDFPQGALVKTKRGLIFILPERRQSVILFALKKSVQIPAFQYITNAIGDAKPEVDRATDGAIDLAIRKGAQ